MGRFQNIAVPLLALLVLLLSSCTFVEIQNISEVNARVLVRVPDSGSGYTRSIQPGEIASVFSGYGGGYTVTMLPDEQYRSLLLSLQDQITRRLFEERATLTGEEVARLVQNLNDITEQLDLLARPGASCSGTVPDFETALVLVSWDASGGDWQLSCN